MRNLSRVILYLGTIFICTFHLNGCSEPPASTVDPVTGNTRLESNTQANLPPTTKTLYAMSNILATQGKDSDCEFVLRRIIEQDPQFLPAYNSLAELQMRQRRINEAIETISSGLRIRPKDPVLLNNLGMCWTVSRNYENAMEMFTRAAGLAPENTRYRANMAMTLGLMGRYEESLSLFKQILPENQAEHNLTVIRLAKKRAEPDPAPRLHNGKLYFPLK